MLSHLFDIKTLLPLGQGPRKSFGGRRLWPIRLTGQLDARTRYTFSSSEPFHNRAMQRLGLSGRVRWQMCWI